MHAATVILQLVGSGQYEKAFGIPLDAGKAAINRAHIRKLHACRDDEKAREEINRVKALLLEETPQNKARRLLNIGEPEYACRLLEGCLTEDSSAHEYHMLGFVLYRMDRYAEAASHMEKAFELTPSPFNAIWLGQNYERMTRTADALQAYRFAIEQRGHETEYRLTGNICYYAGELEDALHCYYHAIKAGCRDEDVYEKVRIIRGRMRMSRVKEWFTRLFKSGAAQR